MNLPNKLSLSRILFVPVFLVFVMPEELFGITSDLVIGIMRAMALVIAIVVAVTDYWDGKLARKYNMITNMGKLLDPLADKIFVTAGMVALVEIGVIPGWAVILVISREFLITGLRSLALEAGRVISADRLGKHKTGWQLGLIITSLVVLTAWDFFRVAGVVDNQIVHLVGIIMIWIPLVVTLILTFLSGWNYTVKNIDLLTKE
jgi:CDP-diacylglycerol---glycerol-3-phosphate 3-phosphatidyltransferase